MVSTPVLGKCFVQIFNQAINIFLDTRCYIITFVIIEAVMAAQSSFEFISVVGGGCDVIFNITDGALELIFFVLEGGYCLSFC